MDLISEEPKYDVIIVGSGICGGWAAKEFCERGLKTLIIERGNAVPDSSKSNTISNPVSDSFSKNKPFLIAADEHPYIQEKPFEWVRGYQVGGKSITWARQTQRWSKYDFEAPSRDLFAVPWPIEYRDLAPWYSHVEKFVGISGNRDGLETLPDCECLEGFEMNAAEKSLQQRIINNYKDRYVVMGRCAHLTTPKPIHYEQGRSGCRLRRICNTGCPGGSYFSSISSTLPWAKKTGNLTLLTSSIVHSVLYDSDLGKASGVIVIDAITNQKRRFNGAIIFLNASTLNTNLILLNSKCERFPNGLGNDNGLLGKYIAFHNYRGRITGKLYNNMDHYDNGLRPTMLIMPAFRNVIKQEKNFKRGYLIAFRAIRKHIADETAKTDKSKINNGKKHPWSVYMMMQGETIPKFENHVRLSSSVKDMWGIPQLIVSVSYDDNDELMLLDFFQQGTEMLRVAGCCDIMTRDTSQPPGQDIHEMGGVRMGKDSRTSLLNKWNQLYSCRNVFVTDGSCMTSTGTQNPSLTFMALTARAADFASREFKNGNL